MKYAIIQVTDGTYTLVGEYGNIKAAEVNFHTLVAALYNETSFTNCMVKIMDENLDTVEKVFIHNEQTQAPTQSQGE